MNAVSALSSAVKTAPGQPPSPKLVKAAQDFEAILLSSWLEKLQASYAGPDNGSDAAHDTLSSMGTQAIASALAARGGIGIGKLLLEHFAKSAEETTTTVPQAEEKIFSGTKVSPSLADRFLMKTP